MQVEKMFRMTHRSPKHSPAKLKRTFRKLSTYLEETKATEFVAGRTEVKYSVPDVINIGLDKVANPVRSTQNVQDETDAEWEDLEDGQEEVEDDDDLDD
jgi:hypothetical protein